MSLIPVQSYKIKLNIFLKVQKQAVLSVYDPKHGIYTLYHCFVFPEGEVTGNPSSSLKNDDMKNRSTMICILFMRKGYSCRQ